MFRQNITQKRLKEVLSYDSLTGVFIWKKPRSFNIKEGDVANSKDKAGYIIIKIFGVSYKAHRLAWLYENGYFPENGIDHIDRVTCHNWISNLRDRSQQCNSRNTGNRKNNTSGVKGVYWCKRDKRWKAQVKVSNKQNHWGQYKSFDNAVCARLAGEQCLNWSGCDSNSPAYQYVQKNIIGDLA